MTVAMITTRCRATRLDLIAGRAGAAKGKNIELRYSNDPEAPAQGQPGAERDRQQGRRRPDTGQADAMAPAVQAAEAQAFRSSHSTPLRQLKRWASRSTSGQDRSSRVAAARSSTPRGKKIICVIQEQGLSPGRDSPLARISRLQGHMEILNVNSKTCRRGVDDHRQAATDPSVDTVVALRRADRADRCAVGREPR